MGTLTKYFCDICGNTSNQVDLRTIENMDICITCQYQLIKAALLKNDIVVPRSKCQKCLGKGYYTELGDGPYPEREHIRCNCGKIKCTS